MVISRVSSSKDVELKEAENAWKPGHKRAGDEKDPKKIKTEVSYIDCKTHSLVNSWLNCDA